MIPSRFQFKGITCCPVLTSWLPPHTKHPLASTPIHPGPMHRVAQCCILCFLLCHTLCLNTPGLSCAVPCCAVPCCAVPYGTALYRTVRYSIVLYSLLSTSSVERCASSDSRMRFIAVDLHRYPYIPMFPCSGTLTSWLPPLQRAAPPALRACALPLQTP